MAKENERQLKGNEQQSGALKQYAKQEWSNKQAPSKINEAALASRLRQDKNRAQAANPTDHREKPSTDFSGYSPLAQISSFGPRKKPTGKNDPASAASSLEKISKVLANALKWCWQNIIFFSFSSSIIWIDIHVLGNKIFPKMFCKLGHEWIPPELKKTNPKQAEAFGDQIGSCEKGCCCCVNGFCGLITIAVLAIAAAVMGIINSTIGQVFGWLANVWDSLTHFVGG